MELLEAGKIVAIHALKGEARVQPWCDGPEFLTRFKTVYLAGEPVKVRSARPSKNVVLLKLDGVDTPEAAQKLVNRVVCINRADVKLAVTEAVSALTGLSSDRVTVAKCQ